MKRKYLIATAALIAVASTAVVATAHDRGAGQRGGPGMIFERFDINEDGQITRDEIVEAAAARFAETDANGDGMLSLEEMTAAAEERRAERVARGAERMLERADSDGDGMLSLEEATAAREGGRFERMFDRIDADGDGVITQAEADEMRGRFMGRGHGPRGHDKN